MRAIVQEHPATCAIACVASVLGVSYKRASKLFPSPGRATKGGYSWGYFCRDVVRALKLAKADYTYSYIKPKKRPLLESPRCIAFLRRSKRYPAGHYLARTEKGLWMDPWANFPKNPAKCGFRKRLPGRASYVICPVGALIPRNTP